jgi:hypothetical protein
MENRLSRLKFSMPAEQKQKGSDNFDKQGEKENVLYQFFEIGRSGMVKSLLDYDPVLYGDAASRHEKNDSGKSHDTQSTQLNKPQDDTLAYRRKEGCRILNDKAGHADGGSGGKKSIDEGNASGFRAEGHQEKKGPHEDGPKKTGGQKLGRMESAVGFDGLLLSGK